MQVTEIPAISAAFGCALCTGIGAVLQKVGVSKQLKVTTFDVRLLFRLARNMPYVLGVILSLVGWGLTLLAVHVLPLFVVQSVIASSIIVTAFIEHLIFQFPVSKREYVSIVVVLMGLVLLGLVAVPKTADSVSDLVRIPIIIGPLVIAVTATMLTQLKYRFTTVILAVLSGIAFGATAVIGRMLVYPHPFWRLITNPLTWSLAAYGLVGLLLFTIALQRALATKVNAVSIAAQTLFPALMGVLFFDDKARNGLWAIAGAGALLVVVGCVAIALTSQTTGLEHPQSLRRF